VTVEPGRSHFSATEEETATEHRRSWRSRLLSLPGALTAILVSGVISVALGYYLPGVFSHASRSLNPVSGSRAAAPIISSVIDNTTPPFTMVIPPARTAGGSPGQACDNFRTWGMSRGGEDAGATSFNLVVQGNTNSSVLIYGIRAHILTRKTPLRGAVVLCPTAGTAVARPVRINLDTTGSGRFITSAPHSPFGYTVNKADLEVFQITAATSRCDCRWVLQVKALVAGHPRIFVVTDHGKPFETTAYDQTSPEYEWNYSNGWDVMVHGHSISHLPAGHELPATSPRSKV
jgi:hypothetical protein